MYYLTRRIHQTLFLRTITCSGRWRTDWLSIIWLISKKWQNWSIHSLLRKTNVSIITESFFSMKMEKSCNVEWCMLQTKNLQINMLLSLKNPHFIDIYLILYRKQNKHQSFRRRNLILADKSLNYNNHCNIYSEILLKFSKIHFFKHLLLNWTEFIISKYTIQIIFN